jgi:hypothetical protein
MRKHLTSKEQDARCKKLKKRLKEAQVLASKGNGPNARGVYLRSSVVIGSSHLPFHNSGQ